MKLNTGILHAALSETMEVRRKGVLDAGLHLGRPRFLLGSDGVLHTDNLYLMPGESMPHHPVIEDGVAIVLIGSSVNLPYYLSRCSILQIPQSVDILHVFNLLTGIYDRYDGWMERLQNIAATTASIRQMVEISKEIFENPIFVLNGNFHFLARSDGDGELGATQWERELPQPTDGDELSMAFLNKFLEGQELSTQEQKPILINILDSSTLNVNLFLDGVYSGCLTIDYRNRPHRDGDEALAEALARMLELALRKYSDAGESERSALRKTLQNLIAGLSVDIRQRRILTAVQPAGRFVCVKLRFHARLAQLPMGYMCSFMEKSFASGIAFSYDGAIVAFFDPTPLTASGQSLQEALRRKLRPLTSSMRFGVGISSPFTDLCNARLAYLQACTALENGTLFAPEEQFYCFSRYALTELMTNALGKLPLEMYFPDGLQRLLVHDESAQVSYLQTLRQYLDNGMSASKTAAVMYLSRSTLIERMGRIWRELGTDLSDPDERLLYQILLKAMQIQKEIASKADREQK